MRSRKEQGKQPTLKEGFRQTAAVMPSGYAEAHSSSPAQLDHSSSENHNDLLVQMLQRENLLRAYKRIIQNKGAPGVDGVTVKQLLDYLIIHWESTKSQLLEGTYQPMPVKRVEIPKPGGGVRLLGIPTVIDRLIQQALLQTLTPIFDPEFSKSSFGFRPGKSAHEAVRQARLHIQSGYRWVVDIDLAQFFDRVNHDILMAKVARKVKDKLILKLIRAYLNAGVMVGGITKATVEGTSQGGPISPLLANILLDELDKELTRRGHRFVRYADDCNTFVRSKRAGERVMDSITRFVEGKLKLKVNKDKSAVDRPWKRKFLGFSFVASRDILIRLAPKTIVRFKDHIRELTSRSKPVPMEIRIKRINTFLMGWIGYFRLASAKRHCVEFDGWIRRRLRMCLWKQWKRIKTRWRNLRALGVSEWIARMMANSRRGPWLMSRNLNNALDSSYWKSQGLMSLLERYLELRVSLGTA